MAGSGCGSGDSVGSPAPADAVVETSGDSAKPIDTAVDEGDSGPVRESDPGCPAATAPVGSRCAIDASLKCWRGNEFCRCAPWCSGDPLWWCEPRPIGCPDTAPANGSACSSNGMRCVYNSCGGDDATCTDGVWRVSIAKGPTS